MNKDDIINNVIFFSVIAYLVSWLFGVSAFYTSSYFFMLLGFLVNNFVKNKIYLLDNGKDNTQPKDI